MTEYDNKEMNLEDEESVVSEETDDQSLDTDDDRKKTLSFSFDKLLSSLNMNRKKRDESGILNSYPSPEMLTGGVSPEEDSDLNEDLESKQLLIEEEADELAVQVRDELELGEAIEPELQDAAELETDLEAEDLNVTEYLTEAKEEPEESETEGPEVLDELQPEAELAEEEVLESVMEVVSEEVEPAEAPHSPDSEDILEDGAEVQVAETEKVENEPAEESKSLSGEAETEAEEEFSYSIYQNGDGGIDYDKLVGETKLMTIDSIYSCKNLPKNLNESVFIIELYGKTLPENLPIEVKRQSVLNILKVSSLDVEVLLQDAYNRIDLLNEVLEDVAQKTEEMNETNLAEIAELNRKIEELRQTMANRAKYQQKQNTSIGYEIQRIVNIVEFINPR